MVPMLTIAITIAFASTVSALEGGCMQCPPMQTTFQCKNYDFCDYRLLRTEMKDGCLKKKCLSDRGRPRLQQRTNTGAWLPSTTSLICGENKQWGRPDGTLIPQDVELTCTAEVEEKPKVPSSPSCITCNAPKVTATCPPDRVCQLPNLFTESTPSNGCMRMTCSGGLKLSVSIGSQDKWITADYIECVQNGKWLENGDSSKPIDIRQVNGITCVDTEDNKDCLQCKPISTTFDCKDIDDCDWKLLRTEVQDGCLRMKCLNDGGRPRLKMVTKSDWLKGTTSLICGDKKEWVLPNGRSVEPDIKLTCAADQQAKLAPEINCRECSALQATAFCPPGKVCQLSELYTDRRPKGGCMQMTCGAGLKLWLYRGDKPREWIAADYIECTNNEKWLVNGNSDDALNTQAPYGITCADAN